MIFLSRVPHTNLQPRTLNEMTSASSARDCGCAESDPLAPPPVAPAAAAVPCCPQLDPDRSCDALDFHYRLIHNATVNVDNQVRRVPVEVILHARLERCPGPLALGDLVYSTTLLAGREGAPVQCRPAHPVLARQRDQRQLPPRADLGRALLHVEHERLHVRPDGARRGPLGQPEARLVRDPRRDQRRARGVLRRALGRRQRLVQRRIRPASSCAS